MATAKPKSQTINFGDQALQVAQLKSVAGTAVDVAALATLAGSPQANIADLVAITGGESPTEAEHNLIVTKVNAILTALEAAGILASS